jgi:hypothetical protein
LYELAEQAKAAPASGTACPQCGNAMDENAVLCTSCGYDTRTGKSVAAASGPVAAAGPVLAYQSNKPAKKPAKPVDYMAPDGSLVMGIVLSAVFALVASIVWVVVAYVTGFAIGYIALLIGIAAGIGMQVGHKGYSKAGGLIAACMTILAIIVAKIVVLETIIMRAGKNVSIFDLDSARLGYYFFNPIGLIIIAVGIGAAFRTANGSRR